MGRARVSSIRYRTLDLDTRDGVAALLGGDKQTPVARVDALLKRGRDSGTQADREIPLLEAKVSCEFLAQPEEQQASTHGSAWKGILRSRVEFIGRSLGLKVCGYGKENWTGCGECSVCRAFGSSTGGGKWEFLDSVWEHHEARSRTRVAIDRFTGGARDGALFTQHYERDVTMTLKIMGPPLDDEEDRWVERALLHALRDLDDQLITIGPEGASGYGMASVEGVRFRGSSVTLNELEPVVEEVA